MTDLAMVGVVQYSIDRDDPRLVAASVASSAWNRWLLNSLSESRPVRRGAVLAPATFPVYAVTLDEDAMFAMACALNCATFTNAKYECMQNAEQHGCSLLLTRLIGAFVGQIEFTVLVHVLSTCQCGF